MQDPSYGVAQPLQNHVHLISGHRYPYSSTLNLDQAYRHLAEAPTIVKQVAPMAWQYVQAPQDGTVWLEWISPRAGEHRFASDGYVWGDQEMSRREDFGGYTIEILSHTTGYRPQFDPMATHARTRYHLVAKHPSANAPPPDPNLWLVHYHQTDQSRVMPVNALPIYPQMRQQIVERRWLESQGRIERKDFMLHDREHWPHVTLPGQMPQHQGGHPGMNPMMAQQQQMPHARHPSYPWPQGAGQGPPAKRPRHSGPSGAPGSSDGPIDTSIEDEENVSLGDYFDHLSQRDISTTRYMQHHRWMEEIFSSPYASSHIVPPDLGLGLMGALKGLTEGIVEPPSVEEINSNAPKPPKAKEAARFTNLKKEQVEEFNSRVQQHLEEGQAEIERMKKEHAERMADFKKGSVLMQAEKRLRNATWEGREHTEAAFRLDGISNGDASRETIEDIVKDVESRLNTRITGFETTTMVERGGLQEKQDHMRNDFFTNGEQGDQMQDLQQTGMSGAKGGVSALPDGSQHGPSGTTETQAEALQARLPADVPQPDFQGDQQGQIPSGGMPDGGQPAQGDQPGLDQDDMFGDGGGMDMGDTSMLEGMDMDVDVDNGGIDTSNIDFLDDPSAGLAEPSAPQPEASAPPAAQEADATAQPQPSEATSVPSQLQPDQSSLQTESIAVPVDSSTTTAAPAPQHSGPDTPADLFNDPTAGGPAATGAADFTHDTTFDDLANIDNGHDGDDDNGLGDVDFGMDESAFEGAMHGMEDPGDDGQGQGGTS